MSWISIWPAALTVDAPSARLAPASAEHRHLVRVDPAHVRRAARALRATPGSLAPRGQVIASTAGGVAVAASACCPPSARRSASTAASAAGGGCGVRAARRESSPRLGAKASENSDDRSRAEDDRRTGRQALRLGREDGADDAGERSEQRRERPTITPRRSRPLARRRGRRDRASRSSARRRPSAGRSRSRPRAAMVSRMSSSAHREAEAGAEVRVEASSLSSFQRAGSPRGRRRRGSTSSRGPPSERRRPVRRGSLSSPAWAASGRRWM